jgi:hypothetical protein
MFVKKLLYWRIWIFWGTKNLGFWEFFFFNPFLEGFVWALLVFFYFISWFCFFLFFSGFFFGWPPALIWDEVWHSIAYRKKIYSISSLLDNLLEKLLRNLLGKLLGNLLDHFCSGKLCQQNDVLIAPLSIWKGWWLDTKICMQEKSLNYKCFCIPIQTIEYICRFCATITGNSSNALYFICGTFLLHGMVILMV